jgi:hypothetical protein
MAVKMIITVDLLCRPMIKTSVISTAGFGHKPMVIIIFTTGSITNQR